MLTIIGLSLEFQLFIFTTTAEVQPDCSYRAFVNRVQLDPSPVSALACSEIQGNSYLIFGLASFVELLGYPVWLELIGNQKIAV